MIDEPLPPPESDGDDEEEAEPTESPFETETISYASAEREPLSVVLEGPPVGNGQIDLRVGAPFLQRLNEVLSALAGHLQGLSLGDPGATLPRLTLGRIALSGVSPGSAVLHFTIGEEGVPGQLSLVGEGEVLPAAMEQAVARLIELLNRSSSPEVVETELLEQIRPLPDRIGRAYVGMLNVLVEENVTSTWRSPEQAVTLPARQANRAKDVLERVEIVSVEDTEAIGLLYEADSKNYGFRLEPDEGRTIRGHFGPDLTEIIRAAWDRRVRVRLRVTRRRLNRATRERPPEVELIEIAEVFDGY